MLNLERFDIIEEESEVFNSKDWIDAANLDPRNIVTLREWVNMEVPFKLSTSQALCLEKIRKDLAGKPRPNSWPQMMKGKLRNLENEGALLESILLLCANSNEAFDVLEKIEKISELKVVASKQKKLYRIKSGKKES